jgi:ornithine cyclodeaminase
MGSDDHGKQELEGEVLGMADLVVADSISQCVDHGECFGAVQEGHIAADSILELGHVIKNGEIGRTNEDQITVADLTGVAIQDIQIAKMVARSLGEASPGARERS